MRKQSVARPEPSTRKVICGVGMPYSSRQVHNDTITSSASCKERRRNLIVVIRPSSPCATIVATFLPGKDHREQPTKTQLLRGRRNQSDRCGELSCRRFESATLTEEIKNGSPARLVRKGRQARFLVEEKFHRADAKDAGGKPGGDCARSLIYVVAPSGFGYCTLVLRLKTAAQKSLELKSRPRRRPH